MFIEILKNIIIVLYYIRYYLLVFWVLYLIVFVAYVIMFFKSNYRKESGIGLAKFLFNKKYFAEGLIFMKLEKTDKNPKILTNLKILIKKTVIEIDIIYITSNGIYVIQNQNYKGWISGSTEEEIWTSETLWKTYKFPNPVLENKQCLNYLGKLLPGIELKSFIVFGNRSNLGKLRVNRRLVIKRKELKRRILKDKFKQIITREEVEAVYLKLEPYSNKAQLEESFVSKMIEKLKIDKEV